MNVTNYIKHTLLILQELSKRFFTFGPFESYRQSQALFKSHFDLYTSKKFSKKQNDHSNEEELQNALAEAKNIERWSVYTYTCEDFIVF